MRSKYILIFILLSVLPTSFAQSPQTHADNIKSMQMKALLPFGPYLNREPDPEDMNIGCLKEVWEHTNPSEEQKQFDLQNDYGRGFRISCKFELSATELVNQINQIKEVIVKNDASAAIDVIRFPFSIIPEFTDVTKNNWQHSTFETIASQRELSNRFEEIKTKRFLNMINCISLDKLRFDKKDFISFGNRYFAFIREDNTNFKLAYVGYYSKAVDAWHSRFCQST